MLVNCFAFSSHSFGYLYYMWVHISRTLASLSVKLLADTDHVFSFRRSFRRGRKGRWEGRGLSRGKTLASQISRLMHTYTEIVKCFQYNSILNGALFKQSIFLLQNDSNLIFLTVKNIQNILVVVEGWCDKGNAHVPLMKFCLQWNDNVLADFAPALFNLHGSK